MVIVWGTFLMAPFAYVSQDTLALPVKVQHQVSSSTRGNHFLLGCRCSFYIKLVHKLCKAWAENMHRSKCGWSLPSVCILQVEMMQHSSYQIYFIFVFRSSGDYKHSLFLDVLTECQRSYQLMNYMVQTLLGKTPAPESINTTLAAMLIGLNISKLQVPTCWPSNDMSSGNYKYICDFNVTSLTTDGCMCTNDLGEQRGIMKLNGDCDSSKYHAEYEHKVSLWYHSFWVTFLLVISLLCVSLGSCIWLVKSPAELFSSLHVFY